MPCAAAADGARLKKNIVGDRKSGPALEESCADGADGPTLQENDGVIGEELACSAQQPYSTGGIGGSYSKWDDLDSDSDEETAAQATRVRATYEVVVSATKVRAKPSTSAEVINYRKQGQRLATDAELDGWVRLTARVGRPGDPTADHKGWVLVDGARLGLGPLLRRVPPTVVAQAPTAPRPGPVTTRPAPPSAAARGVDYSKWERFEIDAEKETRDDARAAATPAARAPTLAEQQADLERMARGFDNGAYQAQRESSLSRLTAELSQVALMNEQIQNDALQQDNEGNLSIGEGGAIRICSDDEMGGRAQDYWWGQSESEVTVKTRVDAGVKAAMVELRTTTRRIKLSVRGVVVVDGELYAPIISDASTWALEDNGAHRLLTVTLAKATPTRGHAHWRCAVRGEAEIDPSVLGPEIVTINPNDPSAVRSMGGVA